MKAVFLHAGVGDERSWPRRDDIAYRRNSALDPVDELFGVLDAHGLDDAILIGNSMGGRIAIDAALEDPKRVRGLFLIAPAVSGAPDATMPPEVDALVAAIDAAEEAGDLDELNRLEAHLWLDGPGSPEGRVSGAARALFLQMNGDAMRAPQHEGNERQRDPAWGRLGELQMPTHVLVGDLDLPHLVAQAEGIASRVPHGELEVMTGVAHLPTLERPSDVLASCDRFHETL
jgi:pimeloyl-ACP methyl ester carboxylesterase